MTRRNWLAAFVAGSALAACTAGADVTNRESRATIPASSAVTTAPPPGTDPPGGAAPTVAAPDSGTAPPAVRTEPPDPSIVPAIDQPDPAIVMGTLENGLRYLIRENDNPGRRVEMRLVIDAGSALEADDQGGGAHFLEHMLFNGTERFPENELIDVLRGFGAAFGADINAFTSRDETVYELTMPTDPETVATGLDVLQEWLTAATIEPDQVVAERGIVLDEWRRSTQSSSGRVFAAVEELFLTGTPYEGRDPIGTADEIESTEDGPLRRFYDDWYRPDNAAIVVVGDIDVGDIEAAVVERFSTVVARGSSPPRPELVVTPSAQPRADVLVDPDVAEGFVFVTLPTARDATQPPEAALQRSVLDGLAFDIIATRMSIDALRGEAPFDDARVDSSGFVRSLDAPEILVSADGAQLAEASQAIFDEYERVRRFGFTTEEVARAVSTARAALDSRFAARGTRQDRDFAEEYVRHVLEDEPVPTARAEFDAMTAILDAASPETVAHVFLERLATAAPHVLAVVPADEASDAPDVATLLEQARTSGARTLEPRGDEDAVPDALMEAPEPVEESGSTALSDGSAVSFIAPRVLTFPNGVRVALNVTPIVEGNVAFEGRSPGGLSALAVDDVPIGRSAGAVVGRSGVGAFDPVTLDAFLADRDVNLSASIEPFIERFDGFAATEDLDVLFQLVHLTMTEPRVDPIALEQYVDDELPFAEDPSIDPGYAEFVALLDARYDDERFLLPSVESLDALDELGIERVFSDRFGDASDWTFSLSGDFDVAAATELARRYLGTLPATGRSEPTDYAEPAPPSGVVVETVVAGEGDQANVSFLFTAPSTSGRRDVVAARVVENVVRTRLTDTIREQLGESYSPFASLQLTDGPRSNSELYVSVSTGPELVDSVSSAVLAELFDLRANGPGDQELSGALATVRREIELFSNPQINDEVLDALVLQLEPFPVFLEQDEILDVIDREEVEDQLRRWIPPDRYIEVRVLPR